MTKLIFDIIKKQNGEAFAKAIRRYDSGIFDIPNLPQIVRFAGRNALPLLDFLESLKAVRIKTIQTDKTPFELLEEAGYNAFYADTLKKQNSIRKYFEECEELCTFADKSRYKMYHIIHAVKKNVHEINRADFAGKEKREDAYGTSVISIQILKTGGFISIKNRYNHSVENPDNTFNSNPDNIIKGLSYSLKKYFDVDFSATNAFLGDDYIYQNGQIFKYNDEINNVYFAEDYYMKDGKIHLVNKDCQLMANEYLIDLNKKEVLNITHNGWNRLWGVLRRELKNEKLSVQKKEGMHFLYAGDKEVLAVQDGLIKRLSLYKTKKLKEFMHGDFDLETFNGYSVKRIDEASFINCYKLKSVYLPKCEFISCDSFERVSPVVVAPKLEEDGVYFIGAGVSFSLYSRSFWTKGNLNRWLIKYLQLQMQYYHHFDVQKKEGECLILADKKPFLKFKNNYLTGIYLEKSEKALPMSLIKNFKYLEEFYAASIETVEGENFIDCPRLKKIDLPRVKKIGPETFDGLPELEEVCLKNYPCSKECQELKFTNCPNLRRVYAPNLRQIAPFMSLFSKEGKTDSLTQLEQGDLKKDNVLKITEQKSVDLKFVFVQQERGLRA